MDEDRDAPAIDAAPRLFGLLTGIYLGGGMLNSIVSLLVPRLRITLGLDYAQALCVQLAYYSSYLLFALPIALCIVRIGYMRAISCGLAVIGIGCLAFVFAHGRRDYLLLLIALLVMSSGVTFLQIAGNAVTTQFGSMERMAPRFTLLQAINSLGTVIGPLLGAWFLLGGDAAEAWRPGALFLLIALFFLALSALFAGHRGLAPDAGRRDAPPWR